MRRLLQRRMQGDDGSTLIETVVALVVFALIMSGLAASMAVFAHNTAITKARSAATSLAQKQVETARSLGTTNLSVCAGGGSPIGYPYKGLTYPVFTSTASGCLPFQTTKTSGGYSFTVQQFVLIPPTPVQAAAVIQTKTNTAGVPQTQKLLVVKLSWTTPKTGSYEIDTIMNNNDAVTAAPAQGIRVNVNDQTGTLINISAAIWDYTILNSSNVVVASGSTEDGTTGALSLSPGSYTCKIIAEADAGQSYSPGTNAGMTIDATNDSISGPCSVTANAVTDWTTSWNEISTCTSSGTKGSLSVTVTDAAGAVVSGASVALTNVNGNGGTPGAVTTNASGVALFNASVPDDLYTFTISKTGYTTSSNLGPVCVAGTGTSTATGSLSSSSTCPAVTTKGTVSVTVLDETGTPVSGAKVVLKSLIKTYTVNSTDASGIALFNNNVQGDSYTYTLTKTGYTSSGAEGPVCVTAASTTYISGLLPTAGSGGCASSSTKGTLTVTVTDQTGAGLNGAKVTLTNANGHGGTPGAKNTATVGGVNGVALFSNSAPADPYLFSILPPAGYTNPGTLGPVCVIAGQSVSATAVLQGIMTTQIKVTNSDIQPTKTYNITITDSDGRSTANSVTINRTKNATVTFSSMPTDNYTLKVCVPIAATGNCDAINDPSAVYNWGAIGTTYLTSITDNKGGA